MSKVFFVFSFFTTSLFCCQPKLGGITIEVSDSREYNLTELFASWKLVELKSLINRVDDILVNENKIYIVDRALESVKIFSFEGALIRTITGDLLTNGTFIQPVCIAVTQQGQVFFYDAANQSFFFLNENDEPVSVRKADYYCYRIYETGNGYLVFKNQYKQNNEPEEFYFNVLLTDSLFKVNEKFFPFAIEKNVPRSWMFFKDPVTIVPDGFEFYEPLSNSFYKYSMHQGISNTPITISPYSLSEKALANIDLADPHQVLEKIFKKYSLLNAKKLESTKWSGFRFITKGKVGFYMESKTDDREVAISSLKVNTSDNELILPYPTAQSNGYWIVILDGENYEQLGLPDYSGKHPILDQIIRDGSTYLLLIDASI